VLNPTRLLTGAATVLVALTVSLAAQDPDPKVARGKYVAEEVARCQECHTPRLMTGELVASAWLKGATLPYVPVDKITGWHQKSPDITSTSMLWSRWGDDGMVAFLETTKNPRGGTAGLPMPPYKMSHEDAVAVVAYLKTLK
jgi:mono/diheme cytochrome c family protein